MLISGFWHEHERYDRDNYVKINFENIPEESKYNFQKREEKYCETFEKDVISKIPYDYCSLMHYPEFDVFAKVMFHFNHQYQIAILSFFAEKNRTHDRTIEVYEGS